MRVLTFDRLYAEVLDAAGEIYVELSEPVQYRLIRAVVDSLPLTHYAPLADRPGFIQVLQRLIGELKAARVHPDDFARAVRTLGDEPRLAELAQIYAAYQARLQAQGWADRAGLGWLAVEALEQRAPDVGRDWPLRRRGRLRQLHADPGRAAEGVGRPRGRVGRDLDRRRERLGRSAWRTGALPRPARDTGSRAGCAG